MKKKRSEHISDFLNYVKQVKQEYDFAIHEMENTDKLTQDLLHKLELECTSAAERNQIAKQLQVCRKDRRYYKDIVEETTPIIEFSNDAFHKRTFDILVRILGKTRKAEDYHKNRTYKPKYDVTNNMENKHG